MGFKFDEEKALEDVTEFQSNLYEFLGRHSDSSPHSMLVMSACLIKCAIEMYSTVMPDEDIQFAMEEMIKDIPKITEELQDDVNVMEISSTKH
tara:strand:+ start:1546 stop:1824 length:279 start_codon:yes stop_codon:yes gene_type:complete